MQPGGRAGATDVVAQRGGPGYPVGVRGDLWLFERRLPVDNSSTGRAGGSPDSGGRGTVVRMPPTAAPDPPGRRPRLRLSSPTDLLAAIPYLLGFHPTDSLVLVGIRHRQVVVTFRVDLPPPGGPPDQAGDGQLHYLLDALVRQRPVRVVLVGYGPAERIDALVTLVLDELAARDVPVLDALRVGDDRYWSLVTGPTGEGWPCHPGASPVSAAATAAGLVALPDREELVRRIEPVTGAARVAMERATHDAEVRWGALLATSADLAEVHERIVTEGLIAIRAATTAYSPPEPGPADHAPPSPPSPSGHEAPPAPTGGHPAPSPAGGQPAAVGLGDDEVAWLGLVLGVPRVRDEAWGLADTADRAGQLALWTAVVRRVESRYLAPAASLLAFVAWQAGDGPFAGVVVDHALAADPDHPMAQLLGQAMASGLPPTVWRPLGPAALRRLDGPPPAPAPGPALGRWLRERLRRAVRR
jgi:uncharacterized protein DUF4192